MDRTAVAEWLERYIAAWRSYDAAEIEALFAEEAEYRYRPWYEPVRGRDAIVRDWLEDRDEPGSWDAQYEPWAVDGDAAVARGTTAYFRPDGSVEQRYHNVFLMRFDGEGRCREFTEWYMNEPAAAEAASEAPAA